MELVMDQVSGPPPPSGFTTSRGVRRKASPPHFFPPFLWTSIHRCNRPKSHGLSPSRCGALCRAGPDSLGGTSLRTTCPHALQACVRLSGPISSLWSLARLGSAGTRSWPSPACLPLALDNPFAPGIVDWTLPAPLLALACGSPLALAVPPLPHPALVALSVSSPLAKGRPAWHHHGSEALVLASLAFDSPSLSQRARRHTRANFGNSLAWRLLHPNP